MPQTISNFDALEKQLAKDALEKALKDLHDEITREIEKNKQSFSDEVKKSLANLKETLEKHISNEIDRKLPALLAKNFSHISEQVKMSFNEMFLPVISKAEKNMERLESQGDRTLQSWENMMKRYEGFWSTPFFFMIFASILIGIAVSLTFSYYITRSDRALREEYANLLNWYAPEYHKLKEAQTAASLTQLKGDDKPKNKNQNKKKPSK